MKRFIFSLTLLITLSGFCKSQEVNGLIVTDTANLTIVKIWGSHQERGYAYGYLLGDKISAMVTGYVLPILGPYMPQARQIILDGEDLAVDPEYIVEAIAVVEGMNAAGTNYANVDYVDGLVFNAFLDIRKLLGLSVEGPGCSSLMSWGDATLGTDLSGKSVIARHLDWSPHPVLIQNQVMVIHVPSEEDEQPWAMIGFAGQMSVLSGFNQQIAVFQHMMSDFYGSAVHGAGYEPIWLTLRKAIEKKDFNLDGVNNTLDMFDALSANPQGFADGYILTSLAPATSGSDSLVALVAEVAPQNPFLTFRCNAFPDSIPGDNLYAANFEIKRNNHHHYCNRYLAVVNAIEEGTGIGSEENWQIMRDYSNALSGNIQFMQFIPELDLFRISVHRDGSPAYLKPPVDFSISSLFYMAPVDIIPAEHNPVLTLFPNPVSDILNIQAYVDAETPFTILSFDGKTVLSGILSEKAMQIKTGHLPAGIYLFRAGDYGTITFVKK